MAKPTKFSDQDRAFADQFNRKGANRKLGDDLTELGEIKNQIATHRRKAWKLAEQALPTFYTVYLRARADKKIKEQLRSDMNLKPGPAKFLNSLARHLLGTSRQYSQKLAVIVELALKKRVNPDELAEFIKKSGGINGCVDKHGIKSKKAKGHRNPVAKKNKGIVCTLVKGLRSKLAKLRKAGACVELLARYIDDDRLRLLDARPSKMKSK